MKDVALEKRMLLNIALNAQEAMVTVVRLLNLQNETDFELAKFEEMSVVAVALTVR